MTRPRKKDRHLPPCVYLKHGAYWHVKAGKWTRLGASLSGALEAYARTFELRGGSMDALVDAALEALRPSLKPNTVKQYETAARKLKKILAEFSPEQVRQKHAAAIKRSMVKTPNMANRVLSLARQVFAYALEEQLVEENPFAAIRRYRERQRDRLVSAAEFSAIYACSGPRLQVILELLRLTGQRITAVLRIRRADLTEEGIRFPQHKTDTKRVVKWTPELREVVERAKKLNGNIRALTLLHNRRGKPPDYSTVKIQFDKARAAAGLPDIILHDMRALAATEAEKQGKNPTALLGHTSEQQTRRYLRGRREPVVDGPVFARLNEEPDGTT